MDVEHQESLKRGRSDHPIKVTVWTESHPPVVRARRTQSGFLPPVVLGLVGTLLLHLLALHEALMGSQAHIIRLPERQQPASHHNFNAKPAESLVFVDLRASLNNVHVDVPILASVRGALERTPIAVPPPDPSPPPSIETLELDEEKAPEAPVEINNGTKHARLFRVYTGQIQARIERIWRRPRTPINQPAAITGESFQCQVQIVQDANGYVQEVLLPNCNGTVAWQRSLVLAIQQASPLPAPPNPSVFCRSISLIFVGLPYMAGAPQDDYEIPVVTTAQSMQNLSTRAKASPAEQSGN